MQLLCFCYLILKLSMYYALHIGGGGLVVIYISGFSSLSLFFKICVGIWLYFRCSPTSLKKSVQVAFVKVQYSHKLKVSF